MFSSSTPQYFGWCCRIYDRPPSRASKVHSFLFSFTCYYSTYTRSTAVHPRQACSFQHRFLMRSRKVNLVIKTQRLNVCPKNRAPKKKKRRGSDFSFWNLYLTCSRWFGAPPVFFFSSFSAGPLPSKETGRVVSMMREKDYGT